MEFVKRREIKRLISDGAKDIVTFDEYASNKELYANTKTAIEIEDDSGVILALPYRSKGDGRPGVYDEGTFSRIIYPEEDNSIYVENAQNVWPSTLTIKRFRIKHGIKSKQNYLKLTHQDFII